MLFTSLGYEGHTFYCLSKEQIFLVYQPGSGLSHLMKGTHKLWDYMEKAQSWYSQVFGCFYFLFAGYINLTRTSKSNTQALLWRYMYVCIGSGREQLCKSVHRKKNNKRVSKIPALTPAIQTKAADLCRLYACMYTMSQVEIKIPKKSPCSNDFCNCKSLVTSFASSFALSAWYRSCQVLSKETFSKETWTTLALSFCEDISQHFRDGREREQIILQQGITVVPLNSLKLNKQQEVRPEAEEILMDMTLFPSSQKAQLQCFSTVSDSEFQEIVF